MMASICDSLVGRNADNFESLRVDHGYGLIEFGSDVEQPSGEDGAMRTNSMSEIDGVATDGSADRSPRACDHRCRTADAGIAVDGNECRVTVGVTTSWPVWPPSATTAICLSLTGSIRPNV